MQTNPMQCPKCAYERSADDSAPIYEFPKCGIVYSKYRPPKPEALGRAAESSATPVFVYVVLAAIGLAAAGHFFDVRIPILAALAIFSFWVVRKAIQGSREQEQKRAAAFSNMPYQHCMTCGHDFKHDGNALRGSTTLEVALWVLILWPVALIYSIWRRLGSGKAKVACIVCASSQVVPASSPAAVAHKRSLGIVDA